MKYRLTLLLFIFIVSRIHSEERATGFFPRIFPDTMILEPSSAMYRSVNLPDNFDWRDRTGINYITDIINQGTCGSCWACAGIAQFESAIRIYSGLQTLNIDLSEQELVSCDLTYSGCIGGNFPVEYFESPGVVDESCFPYDFTQTQYTQLPCNSICNDANIRRNYRMAVDLLNTNFNLNVIKNTVYECPTFLGINAYRSLMELGPTSSDSVWMPDTSDLSDVVVAGHALLCVGWDDSQQCLIFKNSWGTEHGDSGFVKIAYECFSMSFPKYLWFSPDSYSTYVFPVDNVRAKLVQNWSCEGLSVKSETTYNAISTDDSTIIETEKFFSHSGNWYMVTDWSWSKDLIDTVLYSAGDGSSLYVAFNAPLEIDWTCVETTAVATECLSNSTIFAYPNPFALEEQSIVISFKLCSDGVVGAKIFDVGYSLVAELLPREQYSAQTMSILWDGKADDGDYIDPGVYFIVIESTSGEHGVAKIVASRR